MKKKYSSMVQHFKRGWLVPLLMLVATSTGSFAANPVGLIPILDLILTSKNLIDPGSGGGTKKLLRNDLNYIGAFRVSDNNSGDSKTGRSSGKIVISPSTGTFFMNGNNQMTIAEFNIPAVVNSTNIDDLAFTGSPVQVFKDLRTNLSQSDPEMLDRITGMYLVGSELVVNAIQYYDGDANNTDTTMVVADAFDLENSTVTGFMQLTGAARSAGWMSRIPSIYQNDLGGDFISGFSSVFAIDGRNSIGPSAFVFTLDDALTAIERDDILAVELLGYSLANSITEKSPFNYADGAVLDNDIWTYESRAFYGLIVPGTTTYFTMGSSGGHATGIGYKIVQTDTGRRCGGYCPYVSTDYQSYAWLFDVEEMIEVKQGLRDPHSLQPYSYGEIDLGGIAPGHNIAGADYDYVNNRLYVSIGNADTSQNIYEPNVVIAVYEFDFE